MFLSILLRITLRQKSFFKSDDYIRELKEEF